MWEDGPHVHALQGPATCGSRIMRGWRLVAWRFVMLSEVGPAPIPIAGGAGNRRTGERNLKTRRLIKMYRHDDCKCCRGGAGPGSVPALCGESDREEDGIHAQAGENSDLGSSGDEDTYRAKGWRELVGRHLATWGGGEEQCFSVRGGGGGQSEKPRCHR